MAPKNIIVCADGTGNKGGYSPDSNVYKIYKTVNKHYRGKCQDGTEIEEQILFYDNGVGTQKNKLWRMLSGGFGLGFRHNVCDLYKFLARNYVDGDRIYFFGFSRGASTVRACNGMIAKCGLAKGQGLRHRELDKLVNEAYKAYEKHKSKPARAEAFKADTSKSHGAVKIKFLGVWDTVVALGFPKRTDITGPVTLVLNLVFGVFEKLSDLIFPHSFYHYKLTDNVEFACQALAIDDERTAFWPFVWAEKNIPGAKDRTPENVEQVWFAGMHSNVGGGYERAGMAGVPLHWMMTRAQYHGLMFNNGAVDSCYDASHVHGRMYNSRSGMAMFYRYHPREIEKLCKDKLLGNIKIHRSVIERLNHRTANYTPGQVPASFDVVDSATPANINHLQPGKQNGWQQTRGVIDKRVGYRKRMYGLMLAATMGTLGYAIYLWNTMPKPNEMERSGFWGDVAHIIDYFTFDMFDALIYVAVVENPKWFIGTLVFGFVYYVINKKLISNTIDAGETLRHYIIEPE
ncbi:MAG: DUF2235 domain-containing protein [Gammaproteobacteria bacterium]|nr:DUF2235 domain-containing protein [Gammaproteobacteria bacterium]MDH5777250.1 DUF2235 domain-containing protein [Gammaproteobacteria bacterium]